MYLCLDFGRVYETQYSADKTWNTELKIRLFVSVKRNLENCMYSELLEHRIHILGKEN